MDLQRTILAVLGDLSDGYPDGAMARPVRERALTLNVEPLRVFLEVVNRGGLTAAAKSLGMTQPAVSLRVRRLEERVGARLIRLDGRSLTVTAHGRDLLAYAAEIVEAHDRAVDHLRRSRLSGTVRLGCNGEVAASGLSQVMSRFGRTHPDIDVMIRVNGSAILGELLEEGEIDVALMQVVDTDGAVRPTDKVWRLDELQFVQGQAVDLTDEDPLPVVRFGPASIYDHVLVEALEAARRDHRVAMECLSIPGAQRAVEAGLGVAVLNTAIITAKMRPWTGVNPGGLPQVAFVLRCRAGAEGREEIDALAQDLAQALVPSDP